MVLLSAHQWVQGAVKLLPQPVDVSAQQFFLLTQKTFSLNIKIRFLKCTGSC